MYLFIYFQKGKETKINFTTQHLTSYALWAVTMPTLEAVFAPIQAECVLPHRKPSLNNSVLLSLVWKSATWSLSPYNSIRFHHHAFTLQWTPPCRVVLGERIWLVVLWWRSLWYIKNNFLVAHSSTPAVSPVWERVCSWARSAHIL